MLIKSERHILFYVFVLMPMSAYPPPFITPDVYGCVLPRFTQWIVCYTGGKDNRECCQENGVTAEFENCLDLCNGVNALYLPSLKYAKCPLVSDAIAKCNYDGNSA
ncbi:DB module domain-containing protein [Ditylenchus destructor]|uniref:DB module domain-containing protein n=1 Tax=Ditylenchus destructor TaxID=166010 RepID=A0AAD4RDR5_9BILA|nr:DB module domain-containing protein [Ditylenchus destructor]